MNVCVYECVLNVLTCVSMQKMVNVYMSLCLSALCVCICVCACVHASWFCEGRVRVGVLSSVHQKAKTCQASIPS